MAATETVWDSSTKARTDLERRKSCALGVSVTPSDEQCSCDLLDPVKLRNALPTQAGEILLHLHWPQGFK
eukprot:7718984-Pyramimonas_sp.AAC.1